MEKDTSHNQFDICGIGMSTVDLIQIVENFPADTGVTEAKDTFFMGGGPVPTALCTAAKLGAKTAVIDRIGNDWRGKLAKVEYENYQVDTRNLELEDSKTTTFASILVREDDGERHIIFSPGDFTEIPAAELPVETLESSSLLHLNGRHWPACLEAAKIVREAGGKVSFDGGANRFDPKYVELLENTDIAIVARDFAENFADSEDVADQLAEMVGLGVEIAAVTSGVEGSWFATNEGEVFHQAAFTVDDVVDTTGCGDAFHGGFLFAHSRGWSVRESAMFASAVAACNVKAPGGRGNLPELNEVLAMIQA